MQAGDKELIELAFSKKKADERKEWLRTYRVSRLTAKLTCSLGCISIIQLTESPSQISSTRNLYCTAWLTTFDLSHRWSMV
jgi:hypothetical protein